jgi:glycosyltransferase involved in cell wall biosynthesis
MPVYNEEGCIAHVIAEWLAEFTRNFGQNFRLVVVNDGSRDKTSEILDGLARDEPRLQVIHQANTGHGGALLRAYGAALRYQPEYVFHVDSDDQFRPEDFRKLWDRRAESPCILGHRAVRHDALHRLVITRFLRLVLLLMYGETIKDSNVPFRLVKADFLRQALEVIPASTFAPNIFLAVLGSRSGANLMNVPVSHADRKTGKVSIVRWKLIKVCHRCVKELLAFRRILAGDRCAWLRQSA